MEKEEAPREFDGDLLACLAERDAEAADRLLGDLVGKHVEPLVTQVVTSRMRRHGDEHRGQIEDVASEAVVAFLLHVGEIRRGQVAGLDHPEAFVAMLASRACSDYFRRVYPAFHSLRNKLRYLLEKYPELARWKSAASGGWVCGLAEWEAGDRRVTEAVEDLDGHPMLDEVVRAEHPADQLLRLFRRLDAPVRFDDLAALMARLWDVQETDVVPEPEQEFADSACAVDVTLGRKEWLGNLWKEVCELSLNQRAALLLNLKDQDGSCGASLFVMTGVATLRQMAAAVEITAERFAELWPKLPLGDAEVALLLGLTRQQVINLRKCARERLARRMKISEGKRW